jgi:hypothetical protein
MSAMDVIATLSVRRFRMTRERLSGRNSLGASFRPFVEFTGGTEWLRRFEKPVFPSRNHILRIRTANMDDEIHVIGATLKSGRRR